MDRSQRDQLRTRRQTPVRPRPPRQRRAHPQHPGAFRRAEQLPLPRHPIAAAATFPSTTRGRRSRSEHKPRNTSQVVDMEKVEVIGDEELQKLLPALAEAARANQQTVERFVPPKVGIVNETASRRHQFILGRRGVGKSSLLRMVERDSKSAGSAVAFIDLETLKGIPYPDVLIQLLIELFKVLEEGLKKPRIGPSLRRTIQRYRARRDLRRLRNDFAVLLSEPESSEVRGPRLTT